MSIGPLTGGGIFSCEFRRGGEVHSAAASKTLTQQGFKDKDKLKDRDCDRVPQELLKREPKYFQELERAKKYVDKAKEMGVTQSSWGLRSNGTINELKAPVIFQSEKTLDSSPDHKCLELRLKAMHDLRTGLNKSVAN